MEIDVTSVKTKLAEGEEFLLLDCREVKEYEVAKIEGATLIPMSEIQDRVAELEPHRDAEIVVHCHHGGRSTQVMEWLQGQGYGNVKNMTGGIDVWSQVVDPDVPRY